jgi:hypothetical protein
LHCNFYLWDGFKNVHELVIEGVIKKLQVLSKLLLIIFQLLNVLYSFCQLTLRVFWKSLNIQLDTPLKQLVILRHQRKPGGLALT